MARLFNDAASQELVSASSPVSGVPISIAAWFRTDDVAADQYIVSIGNSGNDADNWQISVEGSTAGDPVGFLVSDSVTAVLPKTSTGVTVNTWHHACGTSNTTSHKIYLDGGSMVEDTTSVSPGATNRVKVGVYAGASAFGYFSGRIAEVAVWTAILTAAEVAALARGLAPPYVQPAALVGYWPIWGLHSPEIDLTANNRQLTVTGATLANHAPVRPFTHGLWVPTAPLIEEAAAGQPTMRRWGGIPGMTPGPVKIGGGW